MNAIESATFTKIVRPGLVNVGNKLVSLFCKIEYRDGKLSIAGVEGPRANGDCWGSAGQIEMGYSHRDPSQNDTRYSDPKELHEVAPGWSRDMFFDFLDVWSKWHLNDMRAGCEHQRGADWEPRDITLYHYRLLPWVTDAIRDAEKRAEACIKTAQTFTPTPDEVRYANMPDRITTGDSTPPAGYVANSPQYTGDHYNRPSEVKKSNWAKPSEHPLGLLCKPCPTCGYRYGSAWRREEVPADVLDLLQSLPDSDKTPAWV